MRVSRKHGGWEGGIGARERNDTHIQIHTISTALTALVQGWQSVGGKGKGVMVVADKVKAAAGPLAGQLRYGRRVCMYVSTACGSSLITLGTFFFFQLIGFPCPSSIL